MPVGIRILMPMDPDAHGHQDLDAHGPQDPDAHGHQDPDAHLKALWVEFY